MIHLHDLPCPVCGKTGSEIVHTTTYPEQRYPGEFVLRRCTSCGLLFNSPRLDDAELGRLYDGNYYFFLRSDAREFERIVGMYQRTVAGVEEQVSDRRVLDIGCGRGYFPAVLKALGWEAGGVELSGEASDYARSRFGLDVFTGTIEEFSRSGTSERYPLVTAIDVIEHVPDPDAFVRAAAAMVDPGGLVIIDTPNARAKNIELKGVAWKGFNPFHIYLFSIDNLTVLLEQQGMRVEQSYSYGNSATPRSVRDGMIDALKTIGLAGPAASAFFGWKKLTIRNAEPGQLIARAEAAIRSMGPYAQSADSSAELAGSRSGDNIVVVARKV